MKEECEHVWYLYEDDGLMDLQCCKCQEKHKNDDIEKYVTSVSGENVKLKSRITELEDMLSYELEDGTRLRIGDHFTVEVEYPFFSDGHENYNAEMIWCKEEGMLYAEMHPISDRVSGEAGSRPMSDIDISKIRLREAKS